MFEFAVVDTETTGLPNRSTNRIIEIAIVKLSPTLQKVGEFETLLNPERDVGPSSVHGIAARDLVAAPKFADIAGDVLDCIQGCIIVAHNARFDTTFLCFEFERLGLSLPRLPTVCTMQIARGIGEKWQSVDLQGCCMTLGIAHQAPHQALSDARATAELFRAIVEKLCPSGAVDLKKLKCQGDIPWYVNGCELNRSNRTWIRQQAESELTTPSLTLSTLTRRLSKMVRLGDVKHELAGYLNALDHVLEDRIITPDEVENLFETAKIWELRPEEVVEAHQLYIRQLAATLRDRCSISDVQLNDLKIVNSLLGFDESFLREVLTKPDCLPLVPETKGEPVAGKTVCFTGECTCTIGGEFITRECAKRFAIQAGLIVADNVTKNLDLLVVADPYTQSGKAKKARSYNIRILNEPVFWKLIGFKVD